MHPEYEARVKLIDQFKAMDRKRGDQDERNRDKLKDLVFKLKEGVSELQNQFMRAFKIALDKTKRPSGQLTQGVHALAELQKTLKEWVKDPSAQGAKAMKDPLVVMQGSLRSMVKFVDKDTLKHLNLKVEILVSALGMADIPASFMDDDDLMKMIPALALRKSETQQEKAYNELILDVRNSLRDDDHEWEERAFLLDQAKKILFNPDEKQMQMFASVRAARRFQKLERQRVTTVAAVVDRFVPKA